MDFDFFTDRLHIRKYIKSDAPNVYDIVNRIEIYNTTYAIPHPYPRERVNWWIAFIENCNKNGTGYEFGLFLKSTGEYIGNIGLINIMPHHKKSDISYYISPTYWNMGYATEATMAMLDFGFNTIKLHRIGGTCMKKNPASMTVMKNCGFSYEGTARDEMLKDGKYLDIVHMSILYNDYDKTNRSL